MRRLAIAAMAAILAATPALAACPAVVPDDSAEAIQANRERLICLQRELAAETDQRSRDLDFRMLQMRQQQLEMQRRLETISRPPPVFVPVPRF